MKNKIEIYTTLLYEGKESHTVTVNFKGLVEEVPTEFYNHFRNDGVRSWDVYAGWVVNPLLDEKSIEFELVKQWDFVKPKIVQIKLGGNNVRSIYFIAEKSNYRKLIRKVK